MAQPRTTALLDAILSWMERMGASLDWFAATHWGC